MEGATVKANAYSEWIPVGKFIKTLMASVLILVLVVLALSIWFSVSLREPLIAGAMSFPLIFVLLLYFNLRGIQIKINSKELAINYGFFSQRYISLSDIESCEQTGVNFGYLGIGIKYDFDDSDLSSSVINAVKINMFGGKSFVFSSNNPNEICKIINKIKPQT